MAHDGGGGGEQIHQYKLPKGKLIDARPSAPACPETVFFSFSGANTGHRVRCCRSDNQFLAFYSRAETNEEHICSTTGVTFINTVVSPASAEHSLAVHQHYFFMMLLSRCWPRNLNLKISKIQDFKGAQLLFCSLTAKPVLGNNKIRQ